MINNQFSRRNLPTETRLALAYQFKEFEAEKAKERQVAGIKIEQPQEQDTLAHWCAKVENDKEQNLVLPIAHQCADGHEDTINSLEYSKGKTLEVIAQKAGVSTRTAEQYDAIQRKGTEEQKAEVAEGKASIKRVYTQIQKAERLEKNKATQWPSGKYRVIYADPP